MSLILYSGTPGSYKSFHAVQFSLRWLRTGGNLITNFPLNYMHKLKKEPSGIYQCVDNFTLTVPYLMEFAKNYHHKSVHAQTLVVIDEASIKFNSRDFNMADRMQWINFFANHRHFNFNVILITQQDKMLDKQIRGLIETEFKHRALKNYKLFGMLLDLIFHGCFMCVEYWYPCRLRVGADFKLFNQKTADCYDTMALFIDKFSDSSSFQSIILPDGLRCVAPFLYKDVKQEIQQFKFNNMVWKSKRMAEKMVETIKAAYSDVELDAVAFVPVSEKSRTERGYDQSEILATRIADALNIPCVHLLKKIEQRKIQHDLPRSERKENVKNCYECAPHAYQNVLLIDDICTTGFTLSECADKITEYSKCSVFCASYALTINF